jgi:hypothetical protein
MGRGTVPVSMDTGNAHKSEPSSPNCQIIFGPWHHSPRRASWPFHGLFQRAVPTSGVCIVLHALFVLPKRDIHLYINRSFVVTFLVTYQWGCVHPLLVNKPSVKI